MDTNNPRVIAVDIGASHIRISYYSENRLQKYRIADTPKNGHSGDTISEKIISLIRSELSEKEIDSVFSIGVSSAGPLDTKNGEIINSPNMAFPKIKIKKPLEEEFLKNVYLINDCRSGVFGEIMTDSSLKDKDVVYITFSTGIGAGAYIDGNLIQGNLGNAGEVGHIFVDNKYSLQCNCKGTGHWEAYSSGTGIPVFFKEFCRHLNYFPETASKTTSDFILNSAKQGTSIYTDFAEELGKINSRGISAVIAAYSPEIIILDGPVVQKNSDVIIDGIYKYTDRYLSMPVIRLSKLNGLAPLYGAANYAMNMQKEGGNNY
ncbi:MAG: ROK family protein [Methanomicrobium sp.]|nr:ROK family protein [Methanomicrobium sp.]